MNESSHQLSLRLIERCPSCHARVPRSNIHIIDETERDLLTHLKCAQCRGMYLTLIIHRSEGLIGNAIATDLTYDETLAIRERPYIDDDEFLALYRMISGGDLVANFNLQINAKH